MYNSWKYCSKEDTRVEGPWSHGVPPACLNIKGSKAERNKMLLEHGPLNCINEGLITIL